MNKEVFKNLLTDLYNIYNPANIIYVDDLVEKYNRLEFDSLKNIFIKYNRKDSPHYESTVGTDEYIFKLLKEYESGARPLENTKLNNQIIETPKIAEKAMEPVEKIQEKQKETNTEIEQPFKEKEELFKQTLDEIYKDFEKRLQMLKESNDDVIIRIFSTHSNSELNLPNKKTIAGMGKGSRLVVKDENNNTIGLEIVDVTYDGISNINGKPLIEVFVKKV